MSYSKTVEQAVKEIETVVQQFKPKKIQKEIEQQDKEIKGMLKEAYDAFNASMEDVQPIAADLFELVFKLRVKRSVELICAAYSIMVSRLFPEAVPDPALREFIADSLSEVLQSLTIMDEKLQRNQAEFKDFDISSHIELLRGQITQTIDEGTQYIQNIKRKDWDFKKAFDETKQNFVTRAQFIRHALQIFKKSYQNEVVRITEQAATQMNTVRL